MYLVCDGLIVIKKVGVPTEKVGVLMGKVGVFTGNLFLLRVFHVLLCS